MNRKEAKDILIQYLAYQKITEYLCQNYDKHPKKSVRSGELHRELSLELKLTLNSNFYKAMNRIVDELKLRRTKIDSYPFYKGITKKGQTNESTAISFQRPSSKSPA